MPRPEIAPGDRVVIKVGTTSLVGPSGEPDEERLAGLCDGIAAVRAQGVNLVFVSSGAIAAGIGPLNLATRPTDIPTLQAAAAVGQGRLLGLYDDLLGTRGITTGQILLTRYDFMHRQQYVNARNTIDRLLTLGALPVVNENDTVAVDEIRFGDNDRLAALVSHLVRAKLLILLTDRAGVHAADPREEPAAPLLDEVERITPELERAAGGRASQMGSGGMASKLAAAWVATFSGTGVVVAHAAERNVVERVVAGERIGTYFKPREERASARRLWIAFGQPPRGRVTVDEGARRALVEQKRSLLPVGVKEVSGNFSAGDAVDVACGQVVFARGLVRYGAHELTDALGRRSDADGKEVIHRDQLVILDDRSEGEQA